MVQFAEAFPDQEIVAALRRQLGWAHFKLLIPLKDPLKRDFYAEMCRVECWSTRALAKKIDGMLYERTSLSKKPEQLIRKELATFRDTGELTPTLVFQDPYMLDFLDLKVGDFKPADAGQMELYLRWLDRHERKSSEGAPVGIILCAGKKRETVEYLDLGERGIHVAEYLTELPPREVLRDRLHRAIAAARDRLARSALEGREPTPSRPNKQRQP